MCKTKRRGILPLVSVLLIALLFLSCGQKNPLVGKWRSSGYAAELGGEVSLIYCFSADGAITIEPEEGAGFSYSIPFGSYEVNGSRVEITSDEEKSENTFSISGDTLTLTDPEGNASEFTRVQ